MIDFDDVNLAFDQLPERAMDPPLDMESSYPLLREIDGTLYVVSMIYLYGEHYPNRFYLYNTKTKEAESLSFKEGLQRMNIKEFPVEAPVGYPCGEEGEIQDLFFASIREDDTLDKEAFRYYLSTLIIREFPLEGKYYWAFAEWE